MALREKFGRLVLLEETDRGPLGNEYRAARLGPAGFDRLVTVLRFSQRVSADAEATKRLVEEAKVAAQIHSPGLVKMLGVGRVGSSYYLSTELVEGRTVAAVLAECRDGGFSFGPDHALMIASRAAAGLEALNRAIAAGGVRRNDDSAQADALREALVTRDRKTVYRIDDGIPVLLAEEGIATAQADGFPRQ